MPALSYTEIGNEKVLPTIKTTDTEGNSAKYVSNQVGGKKSRKSRKSRSSRRSRRSRSRKSRSRRSRK